MEHSSYTWEPLGVYEIALSAEHRFGTDALLLSHFAAPRAGERVCDLGTGCGILPLLFMQQSTPPLSVTGLELQPQAVAQFTASIARNGLADRLTAKEADLRNLSALPHGTFDRVTCNPPYFPSNSGQTNESDAARLARHEGEGCTLGDVSRAAARLLRFGGTLCLCHRPERLCDVMLSLREAGLEPKKLRLVQNEADKAPWLMLCEAKKGGNPSLSVLPNLILYENETPTAERQAIYASYLKKECDL